MNENIEHLNSEDVITLMNPQTKLRMPHTTFIVDELIISLTQNLSLNEDSKEWLKNGVPAKILAAGKSWKKVKIRLSLEFIADENEQEKSPLDDFRK